VLVLVVIGSLVVLPLLDYTIAIFRSNRVVSDRTAQIEAAKGGFRVAMSDPRNVFLTCDGGGNLTPAPNPTINGISVQTTCTEVEEIGPTQALGFEVPTGAAAMQLGADVPVGLSGTTAKSPAVPPYPATPDWWSTPSYITDPTGAQYSPDAEQDKIWMPDLPRIPPTIRSSTPFDMPAGFDCRVFFPGRYADPVDLSGRNYFASGVYYFEDAVSVASDADVVIGYGLADFAPASDCADDFQVAANVINPTPATPITFDINGGGATFVFGADGRLVVDNSAIGTTARIRFNQRYATADRGGRVSIMTVNGDDRVDGPHVVTDVNSIPQSQIVSIDPDDGGKSFTAIAGTSYLPSSSTYTDQARLPAILPVLDIDAFQQSGSTAPDRGLVKLVWDELTGNDAGGALLGEEDGAGGWITSPYQVQYRVQSPIGSWIDACLPAELVIAPQAVPTDGNEISCSIGGLDIGTGYRFRVRAENEVGAAEWRAGNETVQDTSPTISVPDGPTNVMAVDGGSDDVAQISWDTPAGDGGLPITGYQVDASRIEIVSPPNAAPVVPPALPREHIDVVQPLPSAPENSVVGHIRAYDPNGDDLTLSIDPTSLPPEMTATVDDDEDTIIVTANEFVVAPMTYPIPYTVTDPDGLSATGLMAVDVVVPGGLIPHVPEADPVVLDADLGVPITTRLPVADPDGLPFAPVPVTVDTTGLDPADWAVTVNGIDVTITTTAPDGTYTMVYTFTDAAANPVTSTIEVRVAARALVPVDTCSVTADPIHGIPTACEITLPDLVPGTSTSGSQGYRFDVVAINGAGASAPGTTSAPHPFGFDGTGVGLLGPPGRNVEPWIPEPVIDIGVADAAPVDFSIAGYVAVPMGRIRVDNPNGFDVRVNGGVMTGTFAIYDSRATAAPDSVPIGFKNDIVLQRKVRIVSTAGNIRSTAIVEVNEDGAGYAVNTWVVG